MSFHGAILSNVTHIAYSYCIHTSYARLLSRVLLFLRGKRVYLVYFGLASTNYLTNLTCLTNFLLLLFLSATTIFLSLIIYLWSHSEFNHLNTFSFEHFHFFETSYLNVTFLNVILSVILFYIIFLLLLFSSFSALGSARSYGAPVILACFFRMNLCEFRMNLCVPCLL